jgi:serine/threonine protein kinase
MKPDSKEAEIIAGMLELQDDATRAAFLSDACEGDADLRARIEARLREHFATGAAATVLSQGAPLLGPGGTVRSVRTASTTQGAAAMHPAYHVDAFLRECGPQAAGELEQFVGQLPFAMRCEVRERIQAALRVRELRGRERRPVSDHEEEAPSLPGYRIERKIGQGGLGAVYAAHDEKLNRRVAIKVLRRRADLEVRQRVLEEARHTAALGDPAVVTVFSVLDETDPPAIVMEFVEGYPLDRFTEHLNFEQKALLLREVARGLAVAHARGIVHRDLKPDNVIVGPDMRPRILDFGLALSLEEASRQGRGFEGTPLYASPEQALGRPLTPASDAFSFGSLMFKVLTGKAPFAGNSISQVLEAIAGTSPPFLREVAVGVPQELQAVCLACLAWNPADRPSAETIALELGRFLAGEPVRLKPKLYDDLLRRTISEHENQAQLWESQSIISREERDSLEIIHRRLLADEDHWIIDARRITIMQTILSAATWLTVVASVLMVWMLREELAAPWRWALPVIFTGALLVAGWYARRTDEHLPAATFLAGATLATAPAMLALLAELGVLATAPPDVAQLFEGTFTNGQVLAASLTALCVSIYGLLRLKLTGFAWTTAALAVASYLGLLLPFNFLDQQPEIMALWCLPLGALELVALAFERMGRVRWTLPFHLIALGAIVIGLDVIAVNGPTLKMLYLIPEGLDYFDNDRQVAFSFVLNGMLFLVMMALTERAPSLDLRRASGWLEVLAILHTISALFHNALLHRDDDWVRYDVWVYLAMALFFTSLAPFCSRWRMLCGGLLGCGLGSYLLVEMELVERKPFIIGMGLVGLAVALGAFNYTRLAFKGRVPGKPNQHSGTRKSSHRPPTR